MLRKKPRNLMKFDEIIKTKFNQNKILLIPLMVTLDIKNPLFYRQVILGINSCSTHQIFVMPAMYRMLKIFRFKSPEYHFSIVGIRSCIPQNGHYFRCYYDNNSKIISLLGWERLMELECYIATEHLNRALSLTNARALRTIKLFIEGETELYHLAVIYKPFPDEPVKISSEKLLSCVGKTREFLSSLFNKHEEKEDNLSCSVGRIDIERLMEINNRYQNPPREP